MKSIIKCLLLPAVIAASSERTKNRHRIDGVDWTGVSNVFSAYFCTGDTSWHKSIILRHPELNLILSFTLVLMCEQDNGIAAQRITSSITPSIERAIAASPWSCIRLDCFYAVSCEIYHL